MTELGIGVAGLGHAMSSYQESLTQVQTELAGLKTEAKKLEAWADGVLARS
jgi:hypothetical protein